MGVIFLFCHIPYEDAVLSFSKQGGKLVSSIYTSPPPRLGYHAVPESGAGRIKYRKGVNSLYGI
jgi:hypothetical protein